MSKKQPIECYCEECGRLFIRSPSKSRNGHGRFCSKPCYSLNRSCVSIEERFWKKVTKTKSCWLRTGANVKGYSVISTRKGVKILGHRLSWELHNGPIPIDLDVLHNCPGGDNPNCVNPDHLFLGTHQDNMADMIAKGKHPQGENHVHAKLTDKIVRKARLRYQAGGISTYKLAAEYGVSRGSMSNAILRRTWKHVV